MNYLLSNLDIVRELLARGSFGLVTDIDGTIAEIAPTAEAVRVTPGCSKHLQSLVNKLSVVAAISGRLAIVAKKLVEVDGMVYYGNHGLERITNGDVVIKSVASKYIGKTTDIINELSPVLMPLGITFENKGAGLVFHYRTLPNRQKVRQLILKAIKSSVATKEFKVDKARAVIELRPPLEITKGSVLKEVVQNHNLKAAIYMGDDISDIDAFETMQVLSDNKNFKGLAIGVIGAETPPAVAESADFILRGVKEVEKFLGWLDENTRNNQV